MFKALLMRMLGLRPVWEVRLINQQTKKDLPGTRLHTGASYRKALAVYKKERARLKVDYKLKLQAVCVTNIGWNMSRDTPQKDINQEANQRLDHIALTAKPVWTEPDKQKLKHSTERVIQAAGQGTLPADFSEKLLESSRNLNEPARNQFPPGVGSAPPIITPAVEKALADNDVELEDPRQPPEQTVREAAIEAAGIPEHRCNYSGPMEMGDEGKYVSTCSICGLRQ